MVHHHTLEEALAILKNQGYKLTDKRQDMLQVLYKQSKHLSAKDVLHLLKDTYPHISPDTIYRNLHTFSEIGLLEETEYNGEKYFRACCDTDGHHHHFICKVCGKSLDLELCPLDAFQGQLDNVEITSHRFELFGLCEDCQKKQAKQ